MKEKKGARHQGFHAALSRRWTLFHIHVLNWGGGAVLGPPAKFPGNRGTLRAILRRSGLFGQASFFRGQFRQNQRETSAGCADREVRASSCKFVQFRASSCKFVQVRARSILECSGRFSALSEFRGQVRASSCKFVQVRACPCKFVQVRASSCKFVQVRARGLKRLLTQKTRIPDRMLSWRRTGAENGRNVAKMGRKRA